MWWLALASLAGSMMSGSKVAQSSAGSNATQDNSGWNVNFGGGSITSSAAGGIQDYVMIGAALVALALAVKYAKGNK